MKKSLSGGTIWTVIVAVLLIIGIAIYFALSDPPRPGPDDHPHPPAPPAAGR